jgi:hypothetical protein
MSENDTVDADKPEITEEEKPIAAHSETSEGAAPEAPPVEEVQEKDEAVKPVSREKQREKQRRKNQSTREMDQIVAWFAACGRCSFFLTGYRLIFDEDVMATAVSGRGKKWLKVPWSHDAARLVHKTYGSRVDINCYHYEGQCKECRRRFTYQADKKGDAAGTFRIELKP